MIRICFETRKQCPCIKPQVRENRMMGDFCWSRHERNLITTGCAMAMQSNRISHFFDFRGPSFTIDTACSSSLVALHTACNSLRNGESSMAIAAGVHLNMLPEFWISYSMSRLFGEEGRSFAFDQRGTGYGRGEGCGLVLLKPLEQAIRDNDPIRAVIVGSGINQDGKTPGITMPNGSAQGKLPVTYGKRI
jgi:acyl transferase domain-containing protein